MGASFRDLKIWQKGFELLIEIYKITAEYPKEEKYGLISDTRRSANSVIANIAEAHGRFYFADKVRVLIIARGELEEIKSHLSVAHGLGYITEGRFRTIDAEYSGLGMGINGYITHLEQQGVETRNHQ